MKSISTAALVLITIAAGAAQSPQQKSDDDFRFASGVELVNVTATVTDASGRFIPGLTRDDFSVYEDDQMQPIAQFSAERVPVSLGIVLDASGSMAGGKIDAARSAISRLLYDLLDPNDEVFLYAFSNSPRLVQSWTKDRAKISNAVGWIVPNGGTAMYDAVAEAIPLLARGTNQKKALVLISDGNDTSSQTGIRSLQQTIRESEALVYAVGIDGDSRASGSRPPTRRTPPQPPRPIFPPPSFPTPPFGGPRYSVHPVAQIFGGPNRRAVLDDHVNEMALRQMTDDSGGRTEIIRDSRDLDPTTAGIVDELSKQYRLAYPQVAPKDGRWHTIRLEVSNRSYRVRARRGYVAN